MSRRTGPGGRLRPSTRANRAVPRDARQVGHPRPDGAARTAAASAAPPEHLGIGFNPLDADLVPADGRALTNAQEGSIDPFAEHAGDPPPRPPAPARPDARQTRTADPVPLDIAGARPPEARRRSGGEPRPAAGAVARPDGDDGADRIACTAPQLRRFIKSRVYVPMHELRRRFAINGEDDDVTSVDIASRRIFVGLPAAEGRLLGDLLRNGEVGYELSMDPTTPIVIGVYSMRPVSRS